MTTGMETEIKKIKERNTRVEADKAWETSTARRALIAVFIYLFSAATFYAIHAPAPFVNAIIPAIAFLFSMETFPIIKNFWIRNVYGKERGREHD